MIYKVWNLKGVMPILRKNGCVDHRMVPGASAVRSACDRAEKTREGHWGIFFGMNQLWKARNLRGEKTQGGIRPRTLAKPQDSRAGFSW
jgi:hypothetical protein